MRRTAECPAWRASGGRRGGGANRRRPGRTRPRPEDAGRQTKEPTAGTSETGPDVLRVTAGVSRTVTLFLSVAARGARELVPESFVLFRDVPGKARLVIRTSALDSLALNGNPQVAAVVSDVGFRIEPPDGSGGAHFWLLSHVTNRAPVAQCFRTAGLATQTTAGIEFDDELPALGGGRELIARVPVRGASYAVSALVPELVRVSSEERSVWWRGAPELVRSVEVRRVSAGALAFARVRATQGTVLSRLIGGSVVAAGHYTRAVLVASVGGKPR